MTVQLASNPKLFHQIMDSIPTKSLIKIQKLIENLKHYSDKRFEIFGKDYAKTLDERLDKFRLDNELSDKTDEQVFDYLSLGCRQFTEDELKVTNISTVMQMFSIELKSN